MKLEICIDGLASAQAAQAGGADRLEVCGPLALGGVTPSAGLVEQCLELNGLSVMMMIRPHAGGFCYDASEVDTMRRDIDWAKRLGVEGVVLGALRSDGRIDLPLCRRLIDAARPLSVTFHRAFDLTPDPLESLESLLELRVDRLLTSGQAASALAGASVIRRLVERAGDDLIVMAGAGIRGSNVTQLIQTTGVREVHASASHVVRPHVGDSLGIVHAQQTTDQEAVRAIVRELRALPRH